MSGHVFKVFLFFWTTGFLLLFYAWLETFLHRVVRHEVRLKKRTSPFTILHLSDIHFNNSSPVISHFFDRLAKETFDFIFVTGDIFDHQSGIAACVKNFKKLKARRGFYVVWGNHDYLDYGIGDVVGEVHPTKAQPLHVFRRAVEEGGARVLMNESIEAEAGGAGVLIHGLDDPTTGHANLRALKDFDPHKINILLTHSVDVFLNIGEDQIDLSFSGHSHGGQVRIPFYGAVITHTRLGKKFAEGLHRFKGAVCSVSRGIGTSRFLRLRFLCRPEAIVLTVK